MYGDAPVKAHTIARIRAEMRLSVWTLGFVLRRHLHVLSDIVKKTGFMVFAYDCHGHGKSGPLDPVLRWVCMSWQ